MPVTGSNGLIYLPFYNLHIWGFGPIMFALQVCVGFGGVNPYFLIPASCSEERIAHVWKDTSCSEGHFLSIVFGRTLFEYREFSPNANFITANFISAVFQNYY